MKGLHAVVGVLLALALTAPLTQAQTAALDAESIYQRSAPAVAVVRATRDGNPGTGTAFVIDAAGVLITASHVARSTDSILVDFGQEDPLPASVLGYDARRDVAMLRVHPRRPLPFLEVVESSAVRRGDGVVVIGTPRGRPRVMSTGAIRATGVTLPGLVPGIGIAFDAEVQPGNSGGPLLNDHGQVIGVVIALSRQADVQVGLATASTVLRSAMAGLAQGARVERAWIGVGGSSLEGDPRQGRAAPRGVLILSVVPDGPAARAGLRGQNSHPQGDIIVAVDGEDVDNWNDLLRVLGSREPGQRIRLGVIRTGAYLDVPVVLEARP